MSRAARPYPLARWRGGKAMLASRIVRYLPARPVLDLFGGAGSVVTAHPCGGVWNDVDRRLHALALAVQRSPVQFERACGALPEEGDAAHALWADVRERLDDCSPAEFAWALYHTWGARLVGRCHVTQVVINSWRSYLRALPARHVAWRGIGLSCAHWEEALDAHPRLPVFADPPYPGTMTDGYVATPVDYERLRQRLESHPAPVAMTGWQGDSDWPAVTVDGGRRLSKNIGYAGGREGKVTMLFVRDGLGDE